MSANTKRNLYETNDLQDCIDFVLNVYHSQLREDCNTLLDEFKRCIAVSSEQEHLNKASTLFSNLVLRLNFHLVIEESVVFPLIKNSAVLGARQKNIIDGMEKEHAEDYEILEKIISHLALSNLNNKADLSELISKIKKFLMQFEAHAIYEEENIFKNVTYA